MLDPVTLDQIRTFVTVVDEGSFSAAARRLSRVQSAVSHAMANLEGQLGVTIWNRATRIPTLTDQGRVLLVAARRVCSDADALRKMAEGLVGGLEPSVALVVDSIFPVTALVDLCKEFAQEFPTVQLRVYTETMGAVLERVLDGSCQLGFVGPLETMRGLERQHLTTVRSYAVVGRDHPLARVPSPIAIEVLAEHIQIVLSERGVAKTPDHNVVSPLTWRVADLPTKHALLLGGLGWGTMPEHTVREDLASGKLVRIRPAPLAEEGGRLDIFVVHRPGISMGPATQWVMRRMTELCQRDFGK